MEVLRKGRYPLPIGIWKIIMAVHGAIDMPPFPVIGEAARYLDGEPYIDN